MYAYIDSFRKFGKTNTDNQSIKIKRPYPLWKQAFFQKSRRGSALLRADHLAEEFDILERRVHHVIVGLGDLALGQLGEDAG